MAAPIPKKIGKYDVLDVVGRGGMGVVYRAKDPFLDRMVAIKIMTISYADSPDLLQRFYREAKATANLQHPNIVTVYELGEHEGSPYLAMQYLEGASLDAILRSGQPLSLLQKIDIIIEACHGLSYAHQKGIVHRDIKPGNIMVLKDSSVKIVDFGIARIGDTNFTRTGQFMGSLNYMSLEQLNDKLQVDQRTDVYSTGVVLYQILTGALPFEADSTGATLMKILNENPAPFSKYLSSFPPEIETITLKALAKDRDQRYSSADELALDLTQLADRLKHDQIGHHMQQAELLLQQNNLFQANDELMAVLKLDKQHTKAAAMLRTLRKQIEKEQSTERARQLREQAEDALRREDFEPALGFVEQAIHLDATNVDLQQLKNKVQAAKAEIDHLRQVMQRAENAHRAGNLDTAKQAIEEVLERRPNDTRVKSLHRMIQKELDERMRQKRMETLLEAARKEMTNRRYTAAFDILKEAEKVDPDAPTVRSLLESLNSARDQEQRRRDLEQFTRQIEQALNTDDPQSALNFLAEGLKRFPAEPALLKLKDLAESQNQAAQVKSFVRERIAAAREILNAGNASGALKVLQEALKKAPGNPHLESLVSIAQERMAQDRDDKAKSSCIQQANDALGKRAYAEAIQILEAGQIKFTASPEIDNLLRFAREQQTKDAKKQDVENSVRRAQEFLKNQEYDRAIALLESILKTSPDEELSIVLEEARRRRETLNNQIAAALNRGRQFLEEGSPAKAVEFLQAQPTAFRRSDEFRELVQAAINRNASKPQEPVFAPDPDLEAPDPSKTMMWNTMGPPEIEDEKITEPEPPKAAPKSATKSTPKQATKSTSKPAPAPRVPTGRVTPPVPATVATPGFLQRLTAQQKLVAGAGIGLLLLIILAIAFWPSAPKVVTHPSTPGEVTPTAPNGGGTTPLVVANGSLTIQTNVDSVDVFIDKDPKRVTDGKQLQLTLPAGDHTVRVSKDKYNQLPAKQIHLDKDQSVPVTFSLLEMTGHPGFVEITSTPGATVKVDGQAWGTIGADGKARVQVEPKSAYLLQIEASNAYPWTKTVGPVRADQTLNVPASLTLKPAPNIELFTGPSDVSAGQTVKIAWATAHAKSVDIDNVGQGLNPVGEKDVTVNQSTTYTLTAKGDGGTSTKTLSIAVKAVAARAPVITSFKASPARIQQGDTTALTWSTTDAQSVTIDNGVGTTAANGSHPVSPTQSTTYSLTATGPGGTTNYTASVIVDAKSQPTPPTQPTTTQPSSDAAAITAALTRLSNAYSTQLFDPVKAEWTSMTRDQERAMKGVFSNQGLKALSMQYDSCSNPAISGDSATLTCTETMSFTADKKRQSKVVPVIITLKKTGGVWKVDTKFGK
jgi:tetratricopeptide (TPR) repeat protein